MVLNILITSIKALFAPSIRTGNLPIASAGEISPVPLPSFKLPIC